MKSTILSAPSGILITALFLACAPGSAQQPAATVDGVPIPMAQVEERVAGELLKLEQQRYDLLDTGLAQLLEERLLEAEAQKQGVSTDELLAKQIESKTKPVSDAEVETFFQQNQARLRGGAKEQLLPQIRLYLEQQQSQQIRTEYLSALRSSHEVKVLLEPLRVELDLEEATLQGAADAPVTLVEFSDFQCPACRSFNPTLRQVKSKYGDQVRVAFRQYPLRQIHPMAQKAAEAALCAREQGKFWELHDAMFGNQAELEVEQLKARARELGLDGERFDGCLDSGRHVEAVQADVDRGDRVGVSGTPAVFVNGRAVSPGRVPSLEQLSGVIDDELARRGGG